MVQTTLIVVICVDFLECTVILGTNPLKEIQVLFISRDSKSEDIVLIEKSFICDDPFDVQDNKSFLILGSLCNKCDQMVCNGNTCSFFYFKKRFYFKCAVIINPTEFPKEIQLEIKKYLNNQK